MLTLSSVSVRFTDADAAAVDALSIGVHAGERVALIGPLGAGKTTVLRLAAGLTLPTTGRVEVLDTDSATLGKRAHRRVRRRIGFITQDYALVGPLRVATNVAAGRLGTSNWFTALRMLLRPQPIDEIVDVLAKVGIAEKLWDRADTLSGGQQQRTAIARVLFQAPNLLLADEPVSALDPTRSDSVMTVFTQATLRPGTAMIASMHDAPLALRHFDRIIALRKGKLQFDLSSADVTQDMLHDLYQLDDHQSS